MNRETPRYRAEPRTRGEGWNVIDTHKVIAVEIGVTEQKARAVAAKRNEG